MNKLSIFDISKKNKSIINIFYIYYYENLYYYKSKIIFNKIILIEINTILFKKDYENFPFLITDIIHSYDNYSIYSNLGIYIYHSKLFCFYNNKDYKDMFKNTICELTGMDFNFSEQNMQAYGIAHMIIGIDDICKSFGKIYDEIIKINNMDDIFIYEPDINEENKLL